MPCPDVVFSAQLVMEDATGGRVKLKHSKRHGQLMLDTGSQSVQLVYPRVGRLFQRKFEQPLKCVMGRKILRIYSSNGKRNFTCRLLSEEDTTKCAETLRTFGVEVIAVGESMLSAGRRGLVVQDAAVIAGGEAALQAIRETSPRSMQAEIRDYELSSQLQDDTDAIMRSMFTMNS
ncbi:hypothetical protein PPTG_00963 [Phytophthora nicotianae INRA-310]|uniref:Uncharacterized protein n=3 Tax=Phytophthora nicotianae TaxID=4792 RepID=W2RH53_PHYN3|nr:hypothetical protein PPTG_00963 [Phytophthora nicotianae INRA-310]ETI56284.1 hypothetical protein F443_01131 [Phytophthora nicotianae P1569]ETN24753.1 hypothetical protein PPTG_00963 [Phytophthora nicotianae INRA-310]KUG00646.1 hypothetical protein AM587_10014377 [Phytophthora nicotianae]